MTGESMQKGEKSDAETNPTDSSPINVIFPWQRNLRVLIYRGLDQVFYLNQFYLFFF